MNRSIWSIAAAAIGIFVLVCIIFGAIYMYSGAYNVAATDDLEPLTRYVFSTITDASIRAHAEPVERPAVDERQLVRAGYNAYSDMCVMCHGAPGVEASWVGKGLIPEPPDLGHSAEEFSRGELFWIVKHGIKHTAMPALAPTHDDEAIHELVAFVEQLPDMTPEEYEAYGAEVASDTTQAAADGHGHEGHEH